MTQQADPTYRPADADRAPAFPGTIPTQRGHAGDGATPPSGFAPVPPAGLGAPYPYPAPYGAPSAVGPMLPVHPMPPAPRSSTGRVLAIVGAVVGAVVVVVVLAVVLLGAALGASSTAAPAPPAPRPAPAVSAPAAPAASAAPAPSSAAAPLPADRTVDRDAVQQQFDAAGVRLDQARSTFDSAMQSAADQGDPKAFRAAANDFQQELATYRATVGGLAMPADQQQAVAGTLLPAVDAAITDCDSMTSSTGQSGLQAAAKQFDTDWSTVVDTHNQIDHALAQD